MSTAKHNLHSYIAMLMAITVVFVLSAPALQALACDTKLANNADDQSQMHAHHAGHQMSREDHSTTAFIPCQGHVMVHLAGHDIICADNCQCGDAEKPYTAQSRTNEIKYIGFIKSEAKSFLQNLLTFDLRPEMHGNYRMPHAPPPVIKHAYKNHFARTSRQLA